ncbi:MAG: hypothetical protein M0Z51_11615, partial [Propionibacterium sp.]|nr:hypothetical protein [Propionibacterium sp.]
MNAAQTSGNREASIDGRRRAATRSRRSRVVAASARGVLVVRDEGEPLGALVRVVRRLGHG